MRGDKSVKEIPGSSAMLFKLTVILFILSKGNLIMCAILNHYISEILGVSGTKLILVSSHNLYVEVLFINRMVFTDGTFER